MKFFKNFFLIFIFSIFFNFAVAENNVAFIDMQHIMDKSLAGQSLKKQLESIHKKNLDYFEKQEDSLKKKNKIF